MRTPENSEYEKFLMVRLDPESPLRAIVERLKANLGGLTFVVTDSFDIVISTHDHSDIKRGLGLQDSSVLSEGYVFGEKNSSSKISVSFPLHAKRGDESLQEAVRSKIISEVEKLLI